MADGGRPPADRRLLVADFDEGELEQLADHWTSSAERLNGLCRRRQDRRRRARHESHTTAQRKRTDGLMGYLVRRATMLEIRGYQSIFRFVFRRPRVPAGAVGFSYFINWCSPS